MKRVSPCLKAILKRTIAHLACAIILGLSLFVSGCVGLYNRVLLEGNRAWPRHPGFSVTPNDYSAEALEARGLRTDGVYCLIGSRTPPGPLTPARGDAYWRFWPNGRVMYRAALIPTNGEAADSFEYGYLGYFEFDQDGVLVCEIYVRDSGHFVRHSYSRAEIRIEGDTLWHQSWIPERMARRAGLATNLTETAFRFLKIDGMTKEPDW